MTEYITSDQDYYSGKKAGQSDREAGNDDVTMTEANELKLCYIKVVPSFQIC